MTQLTLKPIIKDMLNHAGIEDVYDFAPSAKDCACPIVVTNETYEQTDLLDDCEYGMVKLEVIAVRETQDEALTAISNVIYALHQADWARYDNDILSIRNMSVSGMPQHIKPDNSGLFRMTIALSSDVCIPVTE